MTSEIARLKLRAAMKSENLSAVHSLVGEALNLLEGGQIEAERPDLPQEVAETLDEIPMRIVPAGSGTAYPTWQRARERAKPEDLALLDECLKRICRFSSGSRIKRVDLYLGSRVSADALEYKHPGWLEHILVVGWESGRRITVGCIQREVGGQLEFHS